MSNDEVFMQSNETKDDVLKNSPVTKSSPKKKCIKRQATEKGFPNWSKIKATQATKPSAKNVEDCEELRQKTLNVMKRQLQVRKQSDQDLIEALTDVVQNLEDKHDILTGDVQKLQKLTECFTKCLHQTNTARMETLKTAKDVIVTFKNETEGLLLRGAIKPDDRPLWFDVYKAFPPTVEPKFARPKPENTYIKPILYKEDIIREKFHAKGNGISVNMLNMTGETQTRRLIEKYQQLQTEGVPDEELLRVSVEAVGSARQTASETTKTTGMKPESVSAKVLAEADLKNIFKE